MIEEVITANYLFDSANTRIVLRDQNYIYIPEIITALEEKSYKW